MKYQNMTWEGVTAGCDGTKPELAISQGFTFADCVPFPDSWGDPVGSLGTGFSPHICCLPFSITLTHKEVECLGFGLVALFTVNSLYSYAA